MNTWATLPPRVTNVLPRDLARSLSRRQYNFDLSTRALQQVKEARDNAVNNGVPDKNFSAAVNREASIGHVANQETTISCEADQKIDIDQSAKNVHDDATKTDLVDNDVNMPGSNCEATPAEKQTPSLETHGYANEAAKSSAVVESCDHDAEGIRLRSEEKTYVRLATLSQSHNT